MQRREEGPAFVTVDAAGNEYTLTPVYTVTELASRGRPLEPRRDLDGFRVEGEGVDQPCWAQHVEKRKPGTYRILPTHEFADTVLHAEPDDPDAV